MKEKIDIKYEGMITGPFIDRVYEVYTYGSQISNFAKPTSNWFKKKLRAVSRGSIHVTNFKILSSSKALQKFCENSALSSTKALQKLCTKLRTKL